MPIVIGGTTITEVIVIKDGASTTLDVVNVGATEVFNRIPDYALETSDGNIFLTSDGEYFIVAHS